ncbi:hypothetical protein [Candidatus Lokiarchaeum ossiferum]|uniref:hypothetical protein n=1 Tax=Candidatus Lokiarchaeum ossiferum TaxID=2951803 RepID=UPI00352DD9FE
MRLLKDRILKEVTASEITSITFEPRKKFIAIGAFQEPVLVYRYPYMKLFKKIIHREKIPITDEEISLNPDLKVIVDPSGDKFKKGNILSPANILFTKNGSKLVIGYENGDILVYNTQLWKKESELILNDKISSMNFIKDNTLLFVLLANWTFHLINTKTWKINKTFQLKTANDGRAVLTNDLKKIYAITDKKRISVIDVSTLEEIHSFKAHNSGINMIKLSPDEDILCSCGNDCKLSLFDLQTNELLSYLLGHSDEVHSFAFSQKGDFIVSGSEDNTLRLWDSKTYKCVKIMHEIPNSFVMERYGELLVMGNVEGDICTFKFY